MCKHNDNDYDCCDCAYMMGKNDAESGEEYCNPYKNWDQCNSYNDGWESVKPFTTNGDDTEPPGRRIRICGMTTTHQNEVIEQIRAYMKAALQSSTHTQRCQGDIVATPVRVTLKTLQAIMLNDGNIFNVIANGTVFNCELKYQKICPGVYNLWGVKPWRPNEQ
jgi:hypothetical protein